MALEELGMWDEQVEATKQVSPKGSKGKAMSEVSNKQLFGADSRNAEPSDDDKAIEYRTQEEEDAAYNQPEQVAQSNPVQQQPQERTALIGRSNSNYSVEGQEARNKEIFKAQTSAHDRFMMGRRQAAEANPYSFSPQERQAYLNYKPFSWTQALQAQEVHDMEIANQKSQAAIAKNKEIKDAERKRQNQYDMAVGDQLGAAYADMDANGVIKTSKNGKRYKVGTVASAALSSADSFLGSGGRDKVTKVMCSQEVDKDGGAIGQPNFLIQYKGKDGKTTTRTMSLGQVMTEMKNAQMEAGHSERNVNNYVRSMFGYNNPMNWDDEDYYDKDRLDHELKEKVEWNRSDEAKTAEKNRHSEAEAKQSETARQFDEGIKQRGLDRSETARQFDETLELNRDKQDLEWQKQYASEEQFDKGLQLQVAQALRAGQDRKDKIDSEREKMTVDLYKSVLSTSVEVSDLKRSGKTKKVPLLDTIPENERQRFMNGVINYIYSNITPETSDEDKQKVTKKAVDIATKASASNGVANGGEAARKKNSYYNKFEVQ